MAKERLVGMEKIEKLLFSGNLRDEIVDKNVEFAEK